MSLQQLKKRQGILFPQINNKPSQYLKTAVDFIENVYFYIITDVEV